MSERALYAHACCIALVLASCSRTHQDGISTETGNPSSIDRDRIALVLIDGQAHVVGEPDAIDPPRGEVEVTIERNDVTVSGPVERDGSFDVEVDARLGDAFSVRVIVGENVSARVHFESDAGPGVEADSGTTLLDGSTPGDAGDSCVNCIDEEIAWRIVDVGGAFPEWPDLRFTLLGCNTFRTQNAVDHVCTRGVEQCMGGMGSVSISLVKAALSADAVQNALDEGGMHGEPEDAQTFTYEIRVGDRTITYRACHSNGSVDVPCTDNPALEALVLRLTQLAAAYTCTPRPDCDSEWEAGPGEATEIWYWHEAASGGCLPMRGSDEGGNGNRYTSPAECLEACPAPSSQADCAEDRSLIELEDLCALCGTADGCLSAQNYCAASCATSAECESSSPPNPDIALDCDDDSLCRPTWVGSCL
jgi:hypothetical protein